MAENSLKFVESSTGRMAYQDQGAGPILLLVHGFPLDHSQWHFQVEALSDTCRVLAIDLPGFGQSPATDHPVSIAGFADDCASFLDAIEVDEPIVLVGLSMGGYVAWEFWRRHGDRLAALVLCNTRAETDSDEVARGRRVMAERVRREGVAIVGDTMLPKLFARSGARQTPLEFEAIRQVIQGTDPEQFAQTQLAMADRVNAAAWLSKIDVPTLVVAGADDLITPAREMKQWSAQLTNAHFVEVPDSGHLAPLENPDVVNEAIAQFVNRRVRSWAD